MYLSLVKFINNLSHGCTSVNPVTNQLGLMNNLSVVLNFDADSSAN